MLDRPTSCRAWRENITRSLLVAASDCMAHLHLCCREFAQLVEANAVAKLPESEFEVDPGLRDMVEAQIKQEEEAVRQVCLLLLPVQIAGDSQWQEHMLAFMYLADVRLLLQHSPLDLWTSRQCQKHCSFFR